MDRIGPNWTEYKSSKKLSYEKKFKEIDDQGIGKIDIQISPRCLYEKRKIYIYIYIKVKINIKGTRKMLQY